MTEEVKTEAMRELNRLARMSPASPEYGVTRTYLEWMAALPVERLLGLAGGREARRRDPGRRSLRPGKGQGPHSGLPGGAATAAGAEGADPVLRGTSGRGQDFAGHAPSRAPWAASSRASRWAACTTRRRSAAIAAPISARCRARSFRRCGAPASTTRSSCWTRWTSWAAISAATPPRRCSRCSTRNRTPPSATTTWMCRSTSRRSCSSPRPTCSIPVPDALRDRMEIIPLEGYTEQEKVIIAFRYLIPRQTRENGLDAGDRYSLQRRGRAFHRAPLYARGRRAQSGARNRHDLPQAGAAHRRGNARRADGRHSATWWRRTWARRVSAPTRKWRSGRGAPAWRWAWRGLRWAATFCSSKAARMPGGSKGLIMTGQLGPVMQESVQAALTWVRANATQIRHRPGPVQDQRHSHSRAGRRHPQRRTFGGHHHGDGAALHADGPPACAPTWR